MDDLEDIEFIKKKIEVARRWAEKHFNVAGAKNKKLFNDDLSMAPPAAFVTYPTPDTMEVNPAAMGEPLGITFEYRLAFRKNGSMVWRGYHPVWGHPLPGLEVVEED